jgi:flagellar protein FlbD
LIALSRLGGTVVAINPDLISWIDVTPDTTISILGGDKIIVRESLDEVIARIIEFRRKVGIGRDSWLSDGVLERAAQYRDPSGSQKPSNRPPRLASVPPPHPERK